ncbi:MAG TPA: hypothetical protein VGG76_07945 [Gemmatimonadaceae bacterium]
MLALLLTVGSQAAGAQITSRRPTLPVQSDSAGGNNAGCPNGNGIQISATAGTGTGSSSASNTVIGIGQSVDTTLVFDISRKTWTRTNIAAAITVGLADQSRGTYSVCAGVSALLPNATLSINGARGRVHFAASLADFQNSLRQTNQ